MEGQVFATAIIAPDTSSSNGFQGTPFTGTFNGNSHKITGFTINGGNNWYLGLFGQIGAGGSVKNLGVENCTVSGTSDSSWVGGLAGYNSGSIINCYSMANISGSYSMGGIVGHNHSIVSQCYSTGKIRGDSSSQFVGGLVGRNYYGSISHAYSTSDVNGL